MDNLNKTFNGKGFAPSIEGNNAFNVGIQPFKEVPSLDDTDEANADRINAHDLFSLYTADIIKKDIIYAR